VGSVEGKGVVQEVRSVGDGRPLSTFEMKPCALREHINPLTLNDLQRRRAVSPLTLSVPN
jgi:hypothetical protein